jgi:hypothetical protein
MRRSFVKTLALVIALAMAALTAQPAAANGGGADGHYGSPGR